MTGVDAQVLTPRAADTAPPVPGRRTGPGSPLRKVNFHQGAFSNLEYTCYDAVFDLAGAAADPPSDDFESVLRETYRPTRVARAMLGDADIDKDAKRPRVGAGRTPRPGEWRLPGTQWPVVS